MWPGGPDAEIGPEVVQIRQRDVHLDRRPLGIGCGEA